MLYSTGVNRIEPVSYDAPHELPVCSDGVVIDCSIQLTDETLDRYASMGITPAESIVEGLHTNDVYLMAAEFGGFGEISFGNHHVDGYKMIF